MSFISSLFRKGSARSFSPAALRPSGLPSRRQQPAVCFLHRRYAERGPANAPSNDLTKPLLVDSDLVLEHISLAYMWIFFDVSHFR